MISPRKRKAKEHMVDRHCRGNRRFEDFVNLPMTDEEAIGRVAEMDTLEGRKGGKAIVTFFNVQTKMMFGILCDHKDAWSEDDAVAAIHAALYVNSYPRLELGGMSAFEMMRFVCGDEFVALARRLGLVEVAASDVNLTPALIPDIAKQVVERAQ